jgi:DNA-directed RNA polymerase subunit RPC12/RpoP
MAKTETRGGVNLTRADIDCEFACTCGSRIGFLGSYNTELRCANCKARYLITEYGAAIADTPEDEEKKYVLKWDDAPKVPPLRIRTVNERT